MSRPVSTSTQWPGLPRFPGSVKVSGLNLGVSLGSYRVSLLPAEAYAVLDRQLIGRLAASCQSGRVPAVLETPQVSWHCGDGERDGEKVSSDHVLVSIHDHDEQPLLYKDDTFFSWQAI